MNDTENPAGEMPPAREATQPPGAGSMTRKRVAKAGAWSLVGHAADQGTRFAGSVVFSWLLAPEVFGLMTIVNVFMRGLAMFSDLGLGLNIIQSKRGEDPGFLRTAWTIQIARAALIAGIASLCAWPLAAAKGEWGLLWYLPAAAFGTILAGFKATTVFTLNRRLDMKRSTAIDVSGALIAMTATIGLAYWWRSIWALIVGGWIGTAVLVAMSHAMVPGPAMRFQFDRGASRELLHFGKWIFISTILTFLATYAGDIVMSMFMTAATLGIYTRASLVSRGVTEVVTVVANRVLLPVYSEIIRTNASGLRGQVFKIRAGLMALTLPPACALVVFGPEIVGLLYPENMAAAGEFLPVLGVGTLFSVILLPSSNVLLASGDSYRHMLLQSTRSAAAVVAMFIGGYAGLSMDGQPFCGVTMSQPMGLVMGFAASSFAYYPMLAWAIRPYKTWMPLLDLSAVAASAAVIAAGLWLKDLAI